MSELLLDKTLEREEFENFLLAESALLFLELDHLSLIDYSEQPLEKREELMAKLTAYSALGELIKFYKI